MAQTAAMIDPPLGGEITYRLQPDGSKFGVLREKVAVASAAAATSLAQKLPANSLVLAAGMAFDGAIALATGVRVGLGTSTDPDLLALSDTAMTDGTKTGPQRFGGLGLVFANQTAGTSTGASSTAENTCSVFTESVPTIAANTLKPGDIIRVRGKAHIDWVSGTITLKVKIGSSIIATIPVITPADNDIATFDVDIVVRTVGASGTLVSGGQAFVGTSGAAAGAADISTGVFLASTAIDTTAAATVSVTEQFSASDAGHGVIMDLFTIEHIRRGNPFVTSETTLRVSAVSAAGVEAGTMATSSATTGVNAYVWFQQFTVPDVP